MLDVDILQAVIEKANKSLGKPLVYGFENMSQTDWEIYIASKEYRVIIFDHNFARSFWGEEPFSWKETDGQSHILATGKAGNLTIKTNGEWEVSMKRWEYHLQQMVLEEEPLNYLEKFL